MTWDWRLEAKCLSGVDPELFFQDNKKADAAAKRVCGGCKVQAFCLKDALDSGAVGIWGGTTADERASMKRREQRRRPASGANKPLHERLSPEAHKARLARYRQGLTDPQMAAAEGVTDYEIGAWRKAHNLMDNYRGRLLALSQQFLALYEQGYTDREIAKLTGEQRDRVRHWRNRNGLPTIPQRQLVSA